MQKRGDREYRSNHRPRRPERERVTAQRSRGGTGKRAREPQQRRAGGAGRGRPSMGSSATGLRAGSGAVGRPWGGSRRSAAPPRPAALTSRTLLASTSSPATATPALRLCGEMRWKRRSATPGRTDTGTEPGPPARYPHEAEVRVRPLGEAAQTLRCCAAPLRHGGRPAPQPRPAPPCCPPRPAVLNAPQRRPRAEGAPPPATFPLRTARERLNLTAHG